MADTQIPYSNRELDEKFRGLHETLTSQDVVLAKILEQTTKTNGSVRGLQLWEASSRGWIRGFGVAVVCILALVGIIWANLTKSEDKTQTLIEDHINKIK